MGRDGDRDVMAPDAVEAAPLAPGAFETALRAIGPTAERSRP